MSLKKGIITEIITNIYDKVRHLSRHKSIHIPYGAHELHPLLDEKNALLFDAADVQKGLNISAAEMSDVIAGHLSRFIEGKHMLKRRIDENEKTYWTKAGIVRLAFFLESDPDVVDFIEFLEGYQVERPIEIDTDNIIKVYKAIENRFVRFAEEMEKREDVDMDELQKYIETFNMFVQTQRSILPGTQAPVPTSLIPSGPTGKKGGMIFNALNKLASKTGGDAMKFASQTRDSAYDFASNTENDAFNFAQDTRDDAYDFASKTEDDAFNFASKMEDDAYNFVSKMADDAYQFASKGMDYGYMFTTQGEELGPMANRILWMASEIGMMSDRIGEMADRIVHTEHLIINMSVNILNFGLLIDGTIKTLTEAGLKAMGLVFDKEITPLQSTTGHIELIGQNIQTILKQQHEYDMKVLDTQKELRQITISALDKISNEY